VRVSRSSTSVISWYDTARVWYQEVLGIDYEDGMAAKHVRTRRDILRVTLDMCKCC